MADIKTYTDLVPSANSQKPKFMAMVGLLDPMVKIQNMLESLDSKFDVDFAVGQQQDFVGQWIGANRDVAIPLTGIYFAWDNAAVGWELGSWKDDFDPTSGLVSLPDSNYRILQKAKIAANSWDGTIFGAYVVWAKAFPGSYLLIQDNQNMTMTVGIAGMPLDLISQALLVGGYLALKPEGVAIDYFAIVPGGGALFGWNAYSDGLKGWGGTDGGGLVWEPGSWGEEIT